MPNSHAENSFNRLCDLVIITLVAVLFTFSPNATSIFLPVEILFLSTFGVRFLIKKSKLSLYTVWSLGLVLIAFISTTYAPDKNAAVRIAVSVIQVAVFGNLVVPYFRDDKRNIQVFLYACMIGAIGLGVRLWFSAPFSQLIAGRLGGTIDINENQVGFFFAIAFLVAFYYGIVEKKVWFIPISFIFAVVSLFSGSKKVVIVILIGLFLFLLLTRKPTFASFSVLILFIGAGIGLLVLSFTWQPLYVVLGSRIEPLLGLLFGGTMDESTSIRWNMMQTGLAMFLENPLMGSGLGAFANAYEYQTYSHNNYIEILVSLGLVGFIWIYGSLLWVLLKSVKVYFSAHRTNLSILAITLLLVLFADDIARVRFYSETSHLFYALCYAAALNHSPQTGIDIPTLLRKVWQWLKHPRVSYKG